MIDHITLRVKDIEKSRTFYDELLKVIDYKIVLGKVDEPFRGYGIDADPIFEIVQEDSTHPANSHVHVAFKVESKEIVKNFYDKALALGGKDNGPPGPRPHYGDSYYAAFILDIDGNNMEVCLY
jgi:catechol 2,3-dioxygenase-like lactoylglutathione lyase family enzyme